MAEVKISGLSSATTPLAGTEVVPIVQDGETKKVAVSNLGGSLPSMIETNATDLTLWNNGKGNIATNTSFGDSALKSNTTGANNTAIGVNALELNETGSRNVAVGRGAAPVLTTAVQNVVIGESSGSHLTTGASNVMIGYQTGLFQVITGGANVLIGYQANQSDATNSGSSGIAIGASSLTSGNSVVIGTSAQVLSTQDSCVLIGTFARAGGAGSVVLGRNATGTAPNQFVVGSTTYNAGTVATETITPNRTWLVRINGANYKIPMVLIP